MLKRTNQANGPRRHLRATAAALLVAGMLGAGGASHAANPFNSPGPIIFQGNDSPVVIDLLIAQMPVGTTTLELFITNGNDPNPTGDPESVCVDDNDSTFLGDGICAFTGEIQVLGDGYIADFRPMMLGPSMPLFLPAVLGPGVTQVGFNWTEVTAPLEAPWAHKFAEIDIEVVGDDVHVWASGGSGENSLVDATFDTSDFEQNMIALPEPGSLLLLPAAWAGLAVLYRVRRRSRR